MKSVEEIIGDKILELLHLGLSIIVKPDITIDKVRRKMFIQLWVF